MWVRGVDQQVPVEDEHLAVITADFNSEELDVEATVRTDILRTEADVGYQRGQLRLLTTDDVCPSHTSRRRIEGHTRRNVST